MKSMKIAWDKLHHGTDIKMAIKERFATKMIFPY